MSVQGTRTVHQEVGDNLSSGKGNSGTDVQIITPGYDEKISEDSSSGLRSLDTVAAELGIDPKRLRGYIFRNSVRHGDPIGNASLVYDWSLETLRKRLADRASDAP